MSYVNRRRLQGKVQELLNDLLVNQAHAECYGSAWLFGSDGYLQDTLVNWLHTERRVNPEHETKMDAGKKVRKTKKR